MSFTTLLPFHNLDNTSSNSPLTGKNIFRWHLSLIVSYIFQCNQMTLWQLKEYLWFFFHDFLSISLGFHTLCLVYILYYTSFQNVKILLWVKYQFVRTYASIWSLVFKSYLCTDASKCFINILSFEMRIWEERCPTRENMRKIQFCKGISLYTLA